MFHAKFCLCVQSMFMLGLLTGGPALADEKPPRTDQFGDPLPEGALARLGTLRWRHGSNVTFVAYANKGKELLTSCGDGTIRVWDAETGKELRRFGQEIKDNPNQVLGPGGAWMVYQQPGAYQLAVTGDGKTLAMAATDGKVHIWDVATAKELRSFSHGHAQLAGGLTFTPDGKSLITRGMQDYKIKIWDPATGQLSRDFSEQNKQPGRNVYYGGMANPILISPDGKLLAGHATEFDNRAWSSVLRIWDLAEGKETKTFKEENGVGGRGITPGSGATFSPDSKSLAWVHSDGRIQLYDLATGKETLKLGDEKTESQVARMIYAADGKTLAALTTDQKIALFDVASGKELKVIGEEPDGPQGKGLPRAMRANMFYYGGGAIALSPDGKTIAQGWGNLVRQWHLESGKGSDLSGGHRGEVQSVIVSTDGKTAVTMGVDNSARIWDLGTGKERRKFDLPPDTISPLLISATRAVLRDQDGTVRLWDVSAGKELLKVDGTAGNVPNVMVAASIDGKVVTISTSDQTVRVCSLETGKELNSIKDLQGNANFGNGRQYLYGLDINPDGSAVAVQFMTNELIVLPGGGARNETKHTIRMYDSQSGKVLWDSTAATTQCRWFAFTPDGHSLGVINADGTSTMLLDAATGKERCRFQVFGAALAFSDDGQFMATGTAQGPIKVFDVRAGKEIAAFQGNQGHAASLAFSSDAGTLITGGADGTTLVWDIRDQVRKSRLVPEVDAETARKLWNDLGDGDAAKAYRAIVALGGSPKEALGLVAQQLKPARGIDPGRIDKLIVDLDNDDFEVRQKAYSELGRIGGQAVPAMRKVLEGEPSVEVRRQLEQLLDRTAPGQVALTPEGLREVRAIEILEMIGGPEAKSALETLAKGAAGMKLTMEASAALKRWSK